MEGEEQNNSIYLFIDQHTLNVIRYVLAIILSYKNEQIKINIYQNFLIDVFCFLNRISKLFKENIP